MSSDLPFLAGYPADAADEAVDPMGRLRDSAAVLAPLLEHPGLAALGRAAATAFWERGGQVAVRRNGRLTVQAVPLDPLPRLLGRAEWNAVAVGVAQRHRALDAFLADVYRASGRRRSDPDRAPEIVRAGVLPEWAVVGSPGRDPSAVAMAWPGQRRIALLGCDVVRTQDGRWLVRADQARAPAGLGLAVAARLGITDGAPALLSPQPSAAPADAVRALGSALQAAAPPACAGPPTSAVLHSGELPALVGEEAVLAATLGVPLVTPADLWPRVDGGAAVTVDHRRVPVDVLYLRLDDAELAAHRIPAGQTAGALVGEAVRAGCLGLANVPGSGLADDPTLFPAVPAMVRFYLGEEPLLEQVPTWVLADDAQWDEVHDRLHELVVVPVAAYGGGRPVVGPECSPAELAELQAEVAAAPHRFIARALVAPSTSPTLVAERPAPRPVDLRVFSAAIGGGRFEALEAPLSRVASLASPSGDEPGTVAAVKDTWLLPG